MFKRKPLPSSSLVVFVQPSVCVLLTDLFSVASVYKYVTLRWALTTVYHNGIGRLGFALLCARAMESLLG